MFKSRIEHGFGWYDPWSFQDVPWENPTLFDSLTCLVSLRRLNFGISIRHFATLVQNSEGMLWQSQFSRIERLGGITT